MNISKEEKEKIQKERLQMDQTGKISEEILEIIYKHRLFKLIVPKVFDGKELDLPSAIKVFQESSTFDGNFGWLVTIGSGGGMFVPNMQEEIAKKCFMPVEAVIAGSGFPAGRAKKTKDGYIVQGKWFYCSGAQYATTFTVTCVIENEEAKKEEPEILAFALDPDQVEVIEDWDAFGLKGTSSHSIQVNEQFISKERAFSVLKEVNDYGYAIHRYPFDLFSIASFVAIILGLGDHFLSTVDPLIQRRKKQNDLLKKKFASEKERWQKANNVFHQKLHDSWEAHIVKKEIPDALKEEFAVIAKRSARTVVDVANQLFYGLGMQAIMESNALNQIWRDLHTASQHMFLTPTTKEEDTPF